MRMQKLLEAMSGARIIHHKGGERKREVFLSVGGKGAFACFCVRERLSEGF